MLQGTANLPETPWSALPVQSESSHQLPPVCGSHPPDAVMAAAEQQVAAPRERSPSPEAASPKHGDTPPDSLAHLRRSPRLVARYSKSPSPAPADAASMENADVAAVLCCRRSPRLAGTSPAASAPRPSPVCQARAQAGQNSADPQGDNHQAEPISELTSAPNLTSPTARRSSSKRKSIRSSTPKRRGTMSASPRRSSAPRASPLRNMSKRMRMTPKCVSTSELRPAE